MDAQAESNLVVEARRGEQAAFERLVSGSSEFAQTLIEHDLVDGFRLMIDPLVVGGGKRLFRNGGPLKPLHLLESQATSTGAILATYAAAEGPA